MSLAVLTPFTGTPASKSGQRAWRKRLLPVGDVHYQGRTLHFSREYLADLARAFRQHAYDQVPFQIAGPDNRHTNDPERYAGEIVGLDLAEDGLYAVAAVTDRGDRLLTENPHLGVSARIVEAYDRSDGVHFPAALQHVLATLDPRIPGLGPWRTVEAANDVQITIDLSATHFEGDPEPVLVTLTGGDGQPFPGADLVPPDATPAEIDALLDVLTEVKAEDALVERWAEGVSVPQPRQRRRQPGEAELAQFAQIQQSIELANLTDELRIAEDAEDAGRGLPRLAEDRLSHLLGRIGRGSYTPQTPPGFALPPSHAGHPGPAGQPNCGPSDPEFGYCMNRQHTAGCSSLVSTSEAAQVIREPLRASAYAPLVDARGEPWTDQHGQALTILGAVEAAAGVRLTRENVFEGHARRELTMPMKRMAIRDPDDPDDPGIPAPDQTRRTAAALAAHLGIASPDVAARREQARAQRERVLAAQQLSSGGRRHPDFGESPQERAARLSKPGVQLVKVEDGVSGSLPVYRAG